MAPVSILYLFFIIPKYQPEVPSVYLWKQWQFLMLHIRIALAQLHRFLIGTLHFVYGEITFYLFIISDSTCSTQAPLNVPTVHFAQGFLLSLFLFISPSLSLPLLLYTSLTVSFSVGDHTQRFLFPVGVMSLLRKQSALICQRSSRRFIKIQQASTKDVCVLAFAPHLQCPCAQAASFASCSFG